MHEHDRALLTVLADGAKWNASALEAALPDASTEERTEAVLRLVGAGYARAALTAWEGEEFRLTTFFLTDAGREVLGT
ncbi:MAG: hypothetical protein KA758_17590, partial [Acidimicrobiales bacterium]|nr:hypothetical protein [Acidimicrobiales bacterium]